MRALLLALLAGPALALPPVTQQEAIEFHEKGLCQMEAPGKGLTRADGDGWIVSPFPGLNRIYDANGSKVSVNKQAWGLVDMTPGLAALIHVSPGAQVWWCPQYHIAGRDDCGPVPPAFLYDARKVKDNGSR